MKKEENQKIVEKSNVIPFLLILAVIGNLISIKTALLLFFLPTILGILTLVIIGILTVIKRKFKKKIKKTIDIPKSLVYNK